MSFRSRPVLDRKHRPRWQDELRTQQLTVVAFAVAIALAVGIFGASAWNGYWEAHFRPVAAVAGTSFDRADLDVRERILAAETIGQITELQATLGGPRDQIIQQQIDSLSQRFNNLASEAADSLVDSAVLAARAEDYGISVSDDELDAGVAERVTLPERVHASLILVEALPDDADPTDEPTDEQRAEAESAAQDARDRVEGGEDFATVATDVSDDFTASLGGDLGWFEDGDAAYGEYFDALKDAEPGDIVGPVETERGSAVLQLVDRREATTEGGLRDTLAQQGIDDATYRDYVRGQLLVDQYREYFDDEVVVSPAAQQRVAQIFITGVAGAVVPQERARHVLIQPDPELDDQSQATDEQWEAALDEAREVEDLVKADDADWFAIAEEHSDDSGSATRGGDLGWYDPANPQFVTAFAATLASLEVGEVSDPVRTEFGYHVIQKTGERDSPQQQAADLLDELRADPDTFAATATQVSEDYETAEEGGELGWVAPYQLDEAQEEAVFGLTEVGEISDPVDEGADGITIYQLLESSDSREIEADRLDDIRSQGFDRWLDEEVRAPVDSWLDPQYVSSTAAA
ncbi:MAG TPA: peptidylprolyl isomerase [Candidatus Limnocylindria bacterium]|nr:peptidylprolyl isomerase [Candidatus Limnocylindria bacterium]